MNWLRRLIRGLLPRDRYHDQAQEVNIRQLRAELLSKRLAVIERRGTPR
jgi:hypothetical protein